MKTDLNTHEIKELEKAIRRFLKSRKFQSNYHPHQFNNVTTFEQIDSICGFTHTFSGRYAGLFICNIDLYLDIDCKWKISGFGMDEKGNCFADIYNSENNFQTFYMHI